MERNASTIRPMTYTSRDRLRQYLIIVKISSRFEGLSFMFFWHLAPVALFRQLCGTSGIHIKSRLALKDKQAYTGLSCKYKHYYYRCVYLPALFISIYLPIYLPTTYGAPNSLFYASSDIFLSFDNIVGQSPAENSLFLSKFCTYVKDVNKIIVSMPKCLQRVISYLHMKFIA